jgi:succinoglycan biosynthesis transport protein ExoP
MMLQVNNPKPIAQLSAEAPLEASPAELYAWVIGFARRQYLIIALAVGLAFAVAAVYLLITPAKYTGHALLLIDTHRAQNFEPQQSQAGDAPLDSTTVDTQLEVIKSESIALAVIDKLQLNREVEFTSPAPGVVGRLLGLLSPFAVSGAPYVAGPPPAPDTQTARSALGVFQSGLSVWRAGLTYAIGIDFQSLDPDRAAEIANAVADAYVADTLHAKYETARRAAAWLQDRLKELREDASNAERAVVEFKAKNNIVDTGGRLMNEQQLSELNTALVERHTQTAEAKARLERIQQILGGDPDPASTATATVTDTLHNEVITKLRQQYLDLANKEGDWSIRYGANHQAVVNLRNQMREIRKSIVDELRRIAETYKSDYDIAQAREDSVRKSLADLVAKSQTMNEAEVTLHRLQGNAQSARTLYDNFQQRYIELVQQQTFPLTDARMITRATRPSAKSSPRSSSVLAIAAIGGLFLGVGLGLLRELGDRGFHTGAQVEERLRAECLALLPLIKGDSSSAPATQPADAASGRGIARQRNLLWKTADSPFSRFTEAIRALRVAVDAGRAAKASQVIGITSSLPNEGKSTIATALAQLIAMSGGQVVLVDCDLRNPSLSRKLAPGAKAGILHLLLDKVTLEEIVWTDPPSKLAFVPAVLQSRFAQSSEILASEAMRRIFDRMRAAYDYIIVDLPPLAPVVDVRAVTPLIDSFIFAIEWGRTKIEVVEHALGGARGVYDNLLGVVLNKVDMSRLGHYEVHQTSYYNNHRYASYGYVD